VLGRALPQLEPGEVLLLGPDGALLPPLQLPFPWPPRPIVFVPQPMLVLTNGDETRGLMLPVNAAGAAIALPGGRYRFNFAVDRPRWRAAAPDATSNYRAQATIDAAW